MGKMIERGKTMTELMTEQTGGRVTATELTKRHLLVVGQTGSGKTTTTLALLSQLQQTSQTAIILDPTGEYAKLPNTITYRLGVNAYLEAGALTAPQLLRVLELPADPWLVTKLEAAITALRIQKNLLATPASTKSGGAWRVSLKTRWLGWGVDQRLRPRLPGRSGG